MELFDLGNALSQKAICPDRPLASTARKKQQLDHQLIGILPKPVRFVENEDFIFLRACHLAKHGLRSSDSRFVSCSIQSIYETKWNVSTPE
jgi:hypothetical protein